MKSKTRFLNRFRSIFKIPLLEKTLVRLIKSSPSISPFLSKLVPNNYQYTPGTIRTFNKNGVNFKVDIHDYLGHYLYFGLQDESNNSLLNLCNSGYHILDIGTNIGSSLLSMATIVGKDGIVIGFEPDHSNYNQCLENIKLNNFQNIKVYNVGLGNEEGKFTIQDRIKSNNGGKRIMPGIPSSQSNEVVTVVVLDKFLKENHNLKKIDLIKIDVEGFEQKVLEGAEQTLQEYRPTIFIEIDDNNLKDQGASAKTVITFLNKLKYNVVHADTKETLTADFNFSDCHFDAICTPIK